MRFAILSSLCYCVLVRAQLSVIDQYVATESPIAKAGLPANIGPSGSKSAVVHAQLSVVDQYVATESPIAKAGLLANIGPSGSKSAGAKVCVIPCTYLLKFSFMIYDRLV